VLVGDRVADGHRAGHRDLQPALGVGAGEPCLGGVDAALQREDAAHDRHHGGVAVGADAHRHLVREIDAVDELQETVDEVLSRLLAVGHDVYARILLQLQDEERRIALGPRQRVAFMTPRRPELFRLGEPERLRQRSGDGGRKQRHRADICHRSAEKSCRSAAWSPGASLPCASAGPRQAREADVAELVDARDLKSLGGRPPCRFDPGRPHQ
jgi:hypothetical protein